MSSFIAPESIEELLCKTDIVSVISTHVKLKKEGKNFKCCCPFHQEKTPSFVVFPDTQKFHCFGCQESGNAITFLQKIKNLNFVTTIKQLAEQIGLQLETKHNLNYKTSVYHSYYGALNSTMLLYQQQLQTATAIPAQHYLKKRHFTTKTCNIFAIGYAPNSWDFIKNILEKKQFIQQDLIDIGLLVHNETKGTVYDRFRNRLMFPIRDFQGRCIGFGARCIEKDKIKYINSSASKVFAKGKELYGLYESKQANSNLAKLFIVEGYTDVISLHQQGINYAVATLGTAATSDHIAKAFKYTSEIIFCFDGDKAGNAAALRVLDLALPMMQDGKQIKFLSLPEGEDPDSFIRKMGKEKFLAYTNINIKSIDQLLFSYLEKNLDLSSLDGKARLIKLLQNYISKIPEGCFRSLLINEASARTGLNTEDIISFKITNQIKTANINNIRKTDITRGYSTSQTNHFESKLSIKIPLCGYIINKLLHDNALIASIDIPLEDLLQYDGQDSTFLAEIIKTLKENPELNICGLFGYWYGTDKGTSLIKLAELDHANLVTKQEFFAIIDKIKSDINQQQQRKKWINLNSQLGNIQHSQIDTLDRNAYRKAFAEFKKHIEKDKNIKLKK